MARPNDCVWSSARVGPSGAILSADDVETEELRLSSLEVKANWLSMAKKHVRQVIMVRGY